MEKPEDLEWYHTQQAFLTFLLTLDDLKISSTLHRELLSFSPNSGLYHFLEKHKRDRRIKGVMLL